MDADPPEQIQLTDSETIAVLVERIKRIAARYKNPEITARLGVSVDMLNGSQWHVRKEEEKK